MALAHTTQKSHGIDVKVSLYADLESFVETVLGKDCPNRHYMNKTDSFYGDTPNAAIEYARNGDNARAAATDKIMAQIDATIDHDTFRVQRTYAVAGGFPSIPRYLSGNPLNMVQRKKVASDIGPLTILFDCTVSGGIETRSIETRGAATLALLRALSVNRPVELWVMAGIGVDSRSNAAVSLVRITSTPLDLARAAWILGSPSMLRRFMFAHACNVTGGKGTNDGMLWIKDYKDHHAITHDVAIAALQSDSFLTIPGFHIDEGQEAFRTTATSVAWVKAQLEKAALPA